MARHKRADGTSWTTVNCVFCKAVFSKRAHHIANGQQPFCSRDCYFRRKRLKTSILLAQREFQRRLKQTQKGDEWDKYCKREAASHRNDNGRLHQKTWAMKISGMVSLHMHRQAMREDIESIAKAAPRIVLNPRKRTWKRCLMNAMRRALSEVRTAGDLWKIMCQNWSTNHRKRMRRKTQIFRQQHSAKSSNDRSTGAP